MMEYRAALLALVASCYSPRTPEGAPCQTNRECPTPQRCIVDRCSSRDAPEPDAAIEPDALEPDAPPVPVDAAIDAPPDALVLPCTAVGLSCAGTATTFMCGNRCWVSCTASIRWDQASQACAGWMGALGAIEDATEQDCIAARVSNDMWIGLRQDDAATVPGQGWNWNTAANPVIYARWQPGQPNDNDGRESGSEQCAKFQSDDTWDDTPCSNTYDFLCER